MTELRTSIVVTEEDVRAIARDLYDSPRRRIVAVGVAVIALAGAVLAFTREDTVLGLVLAVIAVAVIAFWLVLRVLGRRATLAVMPIGSPIELVADRDGVTLITPIGTNMLRFVSLTGLERVGGAIHIRLITGNTQNLPGRLLSADELAALEALRRAANEASVTDDDASPGSGASA